MYVAKLCTQLSNIEYRKCNGTIGMLGISPDKPNVTRTIKS